MQCSKTVFTLGFSLHRPRQQPTTSSLLQTYLTYRKGLISYITPYYKIAILTDKKRIHYLVGRRRGVGCNRRESDQSSHITLPDSTPPGAVKASLAQACKSRSLQKRLQIK